MHLPRHFCGMDAAARNFDSMHGPAPLDSKGMDAAIARGPR